MRSSNSSSDEVVLVEAWAGSMGELAFMLVPVIDAIVGDMASIFRPDAPLKNLRLVPGPAAFLTTHTNPKSTSLTVPSCVS